MVEDAESASDVDESENRNARAPGNPRVGREKMAPLANTNPNTLRSPHAPFPPPASKNRLMIPPEVVAESTQLALQGKVTQKNAWSIHLIEGMQDTVAQCLSSRGMDQYTQFTKVAHVVEGGAKVWTHRVDSTFLLSTQMVKRLLRNEVSREGDKEDAEERDNSMNSARLRRQRRAAMGIPARTLANEEEIDIACSQLRSGASCGGHQEPGMKGTLTSQAALFRAITEKFDQGHAGGLLLNNTPMGAAGNLVLDRDYSKYQSAAENSQGSDRSANTKRLEPSKYLRVADSAAAIGRHVNYATIVSRKQQDEDLGPVDATSSVTLTDPGANEICANNESPLLYEHERLLQTVSSGRSSGHGLAAQAQLLQHAFVQSQLPSASRAPSEAGSSLHDDGDNWGDFDYDEGSESSHPKFHIHNAVAQQVVSGTGEFEQLDDIYGETMMTVSQESGFPKCQNASATCALAAEDPFGWIPLSQHHVDLAVKSGKETTAFRGKSTILQTLRREAAPRPRPDSNDCGVEGPMKKKRRGEKNKTVTFALLDSSSSTMDISVEDIHDPYHLDPSMYPKSYTTDTAGLRPIGRRLFGLKGCSSIDPSDYVNDNDLGWRRMEANAILLPAFGASVSTLSKSGVFGGLISSAVDDSDGGTSAEAGWWLNHNSASEVRSLFDLSSVTPGGRTKWNLLDKTVGQRMQQYRGAQGDEITAIFGDLGGEAEKVGDYSPEQIDDEGLNDWGQDHNDFYDGHSGDEDIEGSARPSGIVSAAYEELGDDHDESTRMSIQHVQDEVGENDNDGVFELIDAPASVDVLRVQVATAPTQVDVVKLRRTMWRNLNRLCTVFNEKGEGMNAIENGRISAVDSESRRLSGLQQMMQKAAGGEVKFSDVIISMLPQIHEIAKDGTLSPAFFFFSLLFLVNEHSMHLEQINGIRSEDKTGDNPSAETMSCDDDENAILQYTKSNSKDTVSITTSVWERAGADVIIRLPK